MRAEIIAVGTELLLGDVVNTNAAWISRQLAAIGIDVFHHATVGDNPSRIQELLKKAAERSDWVIFTGGLGPTDDDLTVATLANYFNVPLVADPDSEASIRNYFIARGMPMSATNIKQALKPADAITIKNPIGTAPGIFWNIGPYLTDSSKPTYIATFPGVPKELYAMWPQARDLIQQAQQQQGETPMVIVTEFLHFFGIGESMLAEQLKDLMTGDNPTVAPYVGQAQVKIRVAAKAKTPEAAQSLINPIKAEILNRTGAYYFGSNETSLEQRVGELLIAQGLKVSVAESCTGGLVSSRLTDVPGSSAYTMLNVVTYSNTAKTQELGVPEALLAEHGAVSEPVALAMAQGIQQRTGADVGLALTGIAGPAGGDDTKPVGLVYIALCGPGNYQRVEKVLVNPHYSRADIKHWFSQYALFYLQQALCSSP